MDELILLSFELKAGQVVDTEEDEQFEVEFPYVNVSVTLIKSSENFLASKSCMSISCVNVYFLSKFLSIIKVINCVFLLQ